MTGSGPREIVGERAAVAAILIVFFLNGLLWTTRIPFAGNPTGAPDEIHHFEVPQYSYAHGKYPVFGPGRDLFIRVPPGQPDDIYHRIYGWYATNQWGAYLYGAATMLALGATPLAGSIFSARLSSILMGLLVVYLAYLIARQLFPARRDLRIAVPFLAAFIPQFSFVSAYFNADMYSVLCTTLVLYAWVMGLQNGFAWRTTVFLALGLAMSALARVNAWIVVYPVSFALLLLPLRRNRWGTLPRLLLAAAVPAVPFAIWFAYNAVVYGDILAKQVFDQAWAADRAFMQSFVSRGYNFLTFLTGTAWLEWTFQSFWGRFGYMTAPLPGLHYAGTLAFCAASAAGLLKGIAARLRKLPALVASWRAQVLVLFAGVSALTLGASVYNSLYQDFQPQGRYLFPVLVPICTLLVVGLGELTERPLRRHLMWLVAGAWLAALQAAGLRIVGG